MLYIQNFIENRCKQIEISLQELLLRTGLKNLPKAKRRLDELYDGEFYETRGLIERLPIALNLSKIDIEKAISETKREIFNQAEKCREAKFKPHAIILTENNNRPLSIWKSQVAGADSYLRIDFPQDMKENEYIVFMLKNIKNRMNIIENYFYPIIGFIIFYTFQKSINYHL